MPPPQQAPSVVQLPPAPGMPPQAAPQPPAAAQEAVESRAVPAPKAPAPADLPSAWSEEELETDDEDWGRAPVSGNGEAHMDTRTSRVKVQPSANGQERNGATRANGRRPSRRPTARDLDEREGRPQDRKTEDVRHRGVNGKGRWQPRRSLVQQDEWDDPEDEVADEHEMPEVQERHGKHESPPININLVSGLVRWVSLAQERLGAPGMEDMVELYFKTTKESPGLKEMLAHISDVLAYDPAPAVDPHSPQGIAQQWTDLLAQLHGVLNWDCVPADIPSLGLDSLGENDSLTIDKG